MDAELLEFVSHLDGDVPFSPYQQLNDMWAELEDYFDRQYFDIDKFLDELLPDTQPLPTTIENKIPIEESQAMPIKELVQSFSTHDTFFDNLINDSVLDVTTSLVTNEILLKLIRSHHFTFAGRHYKHPFDTIASADIETVVAPHRNDFAMDVEETREFCIKEATFKPSTSLNLDWLSILHEQYLSPGITAEAMTENILRSKSTMLPPTETEIVNVINLLFDDLNKYIEKLSTEFDDHQFFDDVQLDALTRKLQEEILLHSSGMSTPMRNVLLKWMTTVTESFVRVNDHRRQVEEKVSKTIIERAVEVYHTRLMSMNTSEDIPIARKQQKEIIFQGIRHVYSNCGTNFVANVLTQIEDCLIDEKLITAKSKHSGDNTLSSNNNLTILIDLLVSEYASNINQKGLRCAGISTLEQFNDVNGTCLTDAWHAFDRKMDKDKVRVAQRNELKIHLTSKLESESNAKRSEFKRRLQNGSVPSNISSVCSLTSRSVGIHFGFETLTVSCYDQSNNRFRTIFGPVANLISFAKDGIFIGQIPNGGCSLNIESLLSNLNGDRLYDTTYNGELKLDAIVALMMIYIDELVKQVLRTTSRIKYAVAIPSCLNEEIQHIFKTAFNIADINCTLVREQCAITSKFICNNHRMMTKNQDEFVYTMLVKGDVCDSVLYSIMDGKAKVLSASGSETKGGFSSLFSWNKPTGSQCELDRIQSKCNRHIRFLIRGTDQQDVTKQIKNQFQKSKVHTLQFDSNELAEGAALLSFLTIDGQSLDCSIDLRPLSSIKRLSDGNYRLSHKCLNAETRNLQEISTQLRSIIDEQLNELAESKASAKRIIMGKIKDLEQSNVADDEKEGYRQSLESVLKVVDEEFSNKLVIEKIVADCEHHEF